jgi:putative membrane protein
MDSKRIARYFIKLFGTAIAVWVADWMLDGIHVDNIWWALVVSFVLSLLNTFIKPILQLLSFPFILISFGLFLLVINALLLMATGDLVPDKHFYVEGFWPALWGSLIISIVSGILEPKDKDDNNRNGVSIKIGRKQN